MSLFSWFLPHSSQTPSVKSSQPKGAAHASKGAGKQPDTTDASLSFEDIVTRFDELNQDVLRLRQELQTQSEELKTNIAKLKNAHNQNQKLEATLRDVRKNLQQEKKHLTVLQEAIAGPQKQKLAQLKKQGPTQGFIKELAAQRNAQTSEITNLGNTVSRLNDGHGVLQRQLLDTEKRLDNTLAVNQDLKLDLEYIKCTASPPVSSLQQSLVDPIVSLPETPFILVLIDGDAYRFDMTMSKATMQNDNTHPATRIARNIKNYIQAYIVEHELPPHCKLLVRALRNASGARRDKDYIGVIHRTNRAMTSLEDFMIAFTESAPLFDYSDAGTGKERVDGKIHELYHTFISNASCKKIFLAASSDNGFARMLEQYADHPHARAKTCLVDCGNTAREIARLDLETVEWPSVFARQFRPRDAQAKDSRREARRQTEAARAQKEQTDMITALGRDGYDRVVRERAIAQVARDLTGSTDTKAVVAALMRRDGHRRRHGVRASIGSMDGVAPPDSHGEHGSYCIEDGVD